MSFTKPAIGCFTTTGFISPTSTLPGGHRQSPEEFHYKACGILTRININVNHILIYTKLLSNFY